MASMGVAVLSVLPPLPPRFSCLSGKLVSQFNAEVPPHREGAGPVRTQQSSANSSLWSEAAAERQKRFGRCASSLVKEGDVDCVR